MKTVIFAEKPSQARDYANALGIKKKHKEYIEIKDSEIISNAIVTWGYGHLVELKLPKDYKEPVNNWKIENLPYKPEPFEFKVGKDKNAQFNVVKKFFKDADLIINATDIDREGSNIFYSTLNLTGAKSKPIKRLWINSTVDSEIIKGFKNLKDNNQDYQSYQEAYARQISDYLIGMNLSPLYSNVFRSQGLNETFSIGRVQTPTLCMIYEREQAIKNFKPEKFYEVVGEFKAQNGKYNGKAKIKTFDKAELFELEAKHKLSIVTQGNINKVETNEKKQQSPKLHSLSTLQTKINKQYKYGTEKTKKIVQTLYERKILSYPRTDSNLITEEEFNYLKQNLDDLKKVYNKNFDVCHSEPRKRYVDGSKVQEHYAIIPTSKTPSKQDIEQLSGDELNVLNEVVNTTLSMFADDYIYDETVIETDVNGLIFYTKGTVEKNKGWKSLFQKNDKQKDNENENKLPKVELNEEVAAKVKTQEGITTPPKPYTEGELITLMKTCGKTLDDEDAADILKDIQGLGTEATRDGIIKGLKSKQYIKITSNKVGITEKGILLCEAVKGSLLSSPTMTAEWEKRLKYIGQGQANVNGFIDVTMKFINKELEQYNEKTQNIDVQKQVEKTIDEHTIGKCPNCNKGELIDKGKIIKCSTCEQVFFKNFFKKKIPDKQLKALITNGKTSQKLKFKSKAGKPYEAYLKLEDDKEKNIKKYSISFN
ncbi:type IA DNA topoisomerase [Staphylococcus sp. LCT-H4]|uniref:type IA DNA topoisomerase n=1 Tax=Staphylococcus sp. LCT-H4 TaxID=1914308 RepID=UPI0008F467B1|nr:type IA DNA topoisomerase [Staphylococcus sp. LCT-H4]OIJ29099.1 DNA topoisomerase III [Staphylococcus sp. LCT-H4]